MELSRIKAIITEQFRRQQEVVAVLLYGSYAKGKARLNDKMDLAVLYEFEDISLPLKLAKMQIALNDLLQYSVNLVCLNETDPMKSIKIYKFHEPLLVNNAEKLTKYFVRMFSEYADLQFFIQKLKKDIRVKFQPGN